VSDKIDIQTVDFLGSFKKLDQCPQTAMPEYAFIGRSNVGKSSVINHILNRKQIAHVSSTPGKTQSLNFYEINKNWRIVDLPGYGYAKVSKKERKKWQGMIAEYLRNRPFLVSAYLLIDFSIDPQRIDLEQAEWLAENQVPFHILFTKTDKVKPAGRDSQLQKFITSFLEDWSSMPTYFITSALKHSGRDEILNNIATINDAFNRNQ
jgi:GTP-binding protein